MIISLLPAAYALNPDVVGPSTQLSDPAPEAIPLIEKYGDDVRPHALQATPMESAQHAPKCAVPSTRSCRRWPVFSMFWRIPVFSRHSIDRRDLGNRTLVGFFDAR